MGTKNVQIPEELFRCNNEIFYVGNREELLPQINRTREETGCNGNERIIGKYKYCTNGRRKQKGSKGIFGQTRCAGELSR